MEILLWLVPSVAVTVLAVAWVSWVGRDRRGEVDREVAAERLGKALAKELPAGTRRTSSPARDRSTGIAVRPSHGGSADASTRRRAS